MGGWSGLRLYYRVLVIVVTCFIVTTSSLIRGHLVFGLYLVGQHVMQIINSDALANLASLLLIDAEVEPGDRVVGGRPGVSFVSAGVTYYYDTPCDYPYKVYVTI